MAENYVLLESTELTQSAASVTFDNIPQTGYTDLKLVISAAFSTSPFGGGNTWYELSINGGGAGTNLTGKMVYTDGTAYSNTSNVGGYAPDSSNTNAPYSFSNSEIYFSNYTSSSAKSISAESVAEANTSNTKITMHALLWNPATQAAITSITLTGRSAATFAANSTFSLYGIAATGTTPVVAPKATGGNIVANDGTYWYHAFLSSGTFTPQTALTCDVLTIAGGGSGGNNASGGGGAGGLLYSSAQSVASATNYTVIIGAGGANQTSYSSNGFNGSNSTFAGSGFTTLTAIGGGGGQGPTSTPGGSGGSGGGAAGYGSGVRGTGTAGQGNNGGTASPPGESGGGGGAGAAGGNGGNDSARNGVGGAGVNTYSAWASATNTGVSGYYAGGGGGGSGQSTSAGTAGGAGGGGTGAGVNQNTLATAGKINTGSGGGGTAYGNTSGSSNTGGGSGIVIVRYAMV